MMFTHSNTQFNILTVSFTAVDINELTISDLLELTISDLLIIN